MDYPAYFAGCIAEKKHMGLRAIILSPFGTYYLNGLKSRFVRLATVDQTEFMGYIDELSIPDTTSTIFP